MMRTPSPGPGNGWRHTISSGRPSSSPTLRTSSLNRLRSGSTSSKSMSSGRPPTLWWLLMRGRVAACPTRSRRGRACPARGTGRPRCPPAASSNTRMNSSPIALRFSSGSMTPASRSKNRSAACTWIELDALVALERVDDLLALALAHEPGVDVDARELRADGLVHERGGDGGVDATGQPADRPARRPTCSRIASTDVSMIDVIVHVGRQPAHVVQEAARAAPGRAACARPRGGTARRRSAARRARAPPPAPRASRR